ncbi:MAG: Rne/Rng family ribonuclease [Terracidiphilus sp.]|jgi:ribonuclease G
MAKEICISSTPHETRLAILEDDQLAEIYYERENEYTLAGSIYNGRVTRVLPGMQSAFVDVGLERDAFLYVTDFLELEDPEESDELEKAATSGGNQPPREVRHTGGQDANGGRGEVRNGRAGQKPDQKPEQKGDQRQEPRPAPEKPSKDRRFVVEPASEVGDTIAPTSVFDSEQADAGQEDSAAGGVKRWRGRRRRRGGRGGAGSPENQPKTTDTSGAYVEQAAETQPEVAPQIHAGAGDSSSTGRSSGDRSSSQGRSAAPAPRSDAAPVPFVLPGESLSKYGGTPAEDAARPASESAVPARPASSFKPSTMIEAPLAWDGSGLLPGESLSKHRSQSAPQEAAQHTGQAQAEPETVIIGGSEAASFFTETTESAPASSAQPAIQPAEDLFAHAAALEDLLEVEDLLEEELLELDEDELEETTETAFELEAGFPAAASETWETTSRQTESHSASQPIFENWETTETTELVSHNDESASATGWETNASASHKVDPLPPSGFRLFGFGGKKKDEEPAAKPTAVASASSYAPGSGLIEEEVIEEEEFDAPRHHPHGKADEHDTEDFEEETLPTHLRSGDLGEMLQEAHLDHRIQLNFDEKSGDEEEDEEEGEEPLADGRPAATPGQASPQQRRDRTGRGRRGRGGTGGAPGAGGKGHGMSRRSMQTSDLPIISDLLKPGQEILVQIAKEPIAKKGARITSHIALPGRFLVFMPTVSHIGVSRKIASDEERQRLKRILVHERGEASGGFIVRTAAEGASEEELRTDLRFLLNLWADIKKRSDESKSPALIYHDLGLIERILRDQVSSNFSSIWVDSEAEYERIVRFLNHVSPTLVRRVKLYTKETPLFEHFGIQDEIAKALRSKVWLKSGGSIVINQTEALVAIDINTGKYVGKSARLEDTILKTNLDAVPEIVRQIRLRDLGGIIVIDFIDMDERKNRFRVMAALEEALKSDRAPTKVLQFNDFGLVAITRKRVKQSLERTLSVPCPTCQATGMVKSPTTVCNEIYTELRKMKKHFEGADVLLRVNPETVKVLKSNNASWLSEFEELVSKNILVKSDATLHPEQFDIQG